METIYHYTSFVHLEKILHDGYLKVSEADKAFGNTPVIWFSKNKEWEPTANKMVFTGNDIHWFTTEEQFETIGMVRFGITFNSELVSWGKYKYIGNISPRIHFFEEKRGIEIGSNPKDWFCSLKNIPLSECTCIEYFDGSKWQTLIIDEA